MRLRSVALALALVSLAACEPSTPSGRDAIGVALRDGNLTALEARGKRLFAAQCATCHGALGRGDGQNASRLSPPPPDMSVTLAEVSVEERRRIVVEGTAGVGRSPLCPPRGASLRPEELDALMAWLVVASRPATTEDAPPSRRHWRRSTSPPDSGS